MYQIGEFSKIAQVSGRQLRHYDQLGLLTPSHTDSSTGYRFYSANQLPQLNRILALKEMGLSLDQIKRMVGMAEELSEFSRGQQNLNTTPLNFKTLINRFKELNNPYFQHENIVLSISVSSIQTQIVSVTSQIATGTAYRGGVKLTITMVEQSTGRQFVYDAIVTGGKVVHAHFKCAGPWPLPPLGL